LSVDINVSGALRGSGTLRLFPRGVTIEKVALKPSQSELMALPASADGLLHGTVELKMGHERRTMPVAFLQPKDGGEYHYRYDFDRDGADEWVLENSRLRLIVSPESGGRALALEDKTSGENLSSSVGFLRDNFSFTENPPGGSELRERGRYGLFNRPYAAEWENQKKDVALKLHYDAPDVFPGGASIEKSIRLEDGAGVRVDYRIALKSRTVGRNEGKDASDRPQAFVAVNSVPAIARPGRVTRFCWEKEHSSAEAGEKKGEAKGAWQCEDFRVAGESIDLPTGTKRMEVHTTGRPATLIEWDCSAECARMRIEPKHFSAMLRLQFPPLAPRGEAGNYTIHIRTTGQE
jgi:hypothetical protein